MTRGMKKQLDTYFIDKAFSSWSNFYLYMLLYWIFAFIIIAFISRIGSLIGFWDYAKWINILLVSGGCFFPLAAIIESTVFWDYRKNEGKCKVCFCRLLYYRLYRTKEQKEYLQEEDTKRRQFYYKLYSESKCKECQSIYMQKAKGRKPQER